MLPILHLNGYKISNPTVLARITHEELEHLLLGYGWTPHFVEGDDPERMHQDMATTLDHVVEQIQQNPERSPLSRQFHTPALAHDRAQIAQGLDRAEVHRRPPGRRHVPGDIRCHSPCQPRRIPSISNNSKAG